MNAAVVSDIGDFMKSSAQNVRVHRPTPDVCHSDVNSISAADVVTVLFCRATYKGLGLNFQLSSQKPQP